MKKNIPLGVKIVAIINFIVAGWYLSANQLIIALFFTIIAYFLWAGKKWAKFVELIVCLTGIFIGFFLSLGSALALNVDILPKNVTSLDISLLLIFGILSIVVWMVIGLYLIMNKKAKEYFNN